MGLVNATALNFNFQNNYTYSTLQSVSNSDSLFNTYRSYLKNTTPADFWGKDYVSDFKEKTKASYDTLNKNIIKSTDLNKFGKNNANKIKELQPDMQAKTLMLLKYAESKGLKVTITSGFRTQEQQQHLLQTRPKYAAKNSLHCLGRAIDISIEGKKDSDYVMLGQYAKSIGMRWGGDFNGVRERWHFDIGRA